MSSFRVEIADVEHRRPIAMLELLGVGMLLAMLSACVVSVLTEGM